MARQQTRTTTAARSAQNPASERSIIQLKLLGTSEIQIGRRQITPGAEVIFGLGIYLCIRAGSRIPREKVIELIWGGSTESQNRHSLRQMLYKLRQLGFTLDEDGEELYLDPSRVVSDIAQILAEDWPDNASSDDVHKAGNFAPGFSGAVSASFEEWFEVVRGRVASQHRRAALHQINQARREGRWADLDKWALQALQYDPLNEEATLARAESAVMTGSKAMALEIIDEYLGELGDRSQQIGLPATLLRRRIAERRPEWENYKKHRSPLVGRAEPMRFLTSNVDRTTKEGASVCLTGAPGVGKTRLAEEVMNYATFSGLRILFVRSPSTPASRPLSTVFRLAKELLELPGSLGADPTSLAVLERVLHRSPNIDEPLGFTSEHVLTELLEALTDLVDAIASENRLLIVCDDLHNADKHSLILMLQLVAASCTSRVFWLLTSRTPTRVLVNGGWPSGTLPQEMKVPALSTDDSMLLLQRIAASWERRIDDRDTVRLAQASGGNPLFVQELTSHHFHGLATDYLPSTLTTVINQRLTSLDDEAISILRFTAILGPLATIPRLRQLFKGAANSMAHQLDGLEGEGIISLNSMATIELHECWYQSVSKSISDSARALMSLECATLLTSEPDHQQNHTVSWRAAQLFQAGGDMTRAIQQYLQCGTEMLNTGLGLAAVDAFQIACELSNSDADWIHANTLLARAYHSAWLHTEAIDTVNASLARLSRVPDPHNNRLIELISIRIDSSDKMNQTNQADVEHMATLLQDNGADHSIRENAAFVCMSSIFNNFNNGLAPVFLNVAKQIEKEHGPSPKALLTQMIYAVETYDYEAHTRIEERFSAHDSSLDSIPFYSVALRYRAAAYRRLGGPDKATAIAEDALAWATRYGLKSDLLLVSEKMVHGYLDQNDVTRAAECLKNCDPAIYSDKYDHRTQSLLHAKSRLLLQKGNLKEALEYSMQWSNRVGKDQVLARRLPDMATACYCASVIGETELAKRYFGEAIEILNEYPDGLSDYPLEILLRASKLLNTQRPIENIGRAYIRKLKKIRKHDFPPFFENIKELAATQARSFKEC